MRTKGFKNIEVLPLTLIEDGIDAVRRMLKFCYFNEQKTEDGLNALKSYHKEFNEKLNKFADKPKHDWASHGADSFRYLAIAYERIIRTLQNTSPSVVTRNMSNRV